MAEFSDIISIYEDIGDAIREVNGESTLYLPSQMAAAIRALIPPTIPSWGSSTDAEVAELLAAHYAGTIDLTEHWSVGDERTVSLSAMSATGVNESHVAQDVTFVILNADNGDDAITNPNYNYQLVTPINGKTRPAFIVGQKDALMEPGRMNSSNSNAGSWGSCDRKTWCDAVYKSAIPSSLRDIFKQVGVKTIATYNGSTMQTSNGYFFFPTEREVQDSREYSNETEWNALSQWNYYKTAANRIKNFWNEPAGGFWQACDWWERSPHYISDQYFLDVTSYGGHSGILASQNGYIAPVGCI